MVVNCDLVIANEAAKFGFPEVKRGVVAIQGGIPRLAQIAGHQVWLKPLKKKIASFYQSYALGLTSRPSLVCRVCA